jgi:hypothetical protein
MGSGGFGLSPWSFSLLRCRRLYRGLSGLEVWWLGGMYLKQATKCTYDEDDVVAGSTAGGT